MSGTGPSLPRGLRARLAELFPGAVVERVKVLGPDTGKDETEKGLGYGKPLKLDLTLPGGARKSLVFHLAGANDYGHDRRSDRAAEQLLAWDTFNLLPQHSRALDVGAVADDGSLLPLARAGEFYLLTEWGEGDTYAEDLRRIARAGACTPLDLARVEALARWLADIHKLPGTHPGAYVRALRDLVGSGEGIAGLVDGYGDGAPGAPYERLCALERRCLAWRQKLKGRTARLRRTHGDFHPFNIVFATDNATPTLLDTSRGTQGDPADDVTCLSINFLFFGLEHRATWAQSLGALWRRFWEVYLADGDAGVLETAAPFFAWRAVVVCNPAWYPHLPAADRDRLLTFAERVLAAERFEPRWGEEAMG